MVRRDEVSSPLNAAAANNRAVALLTQESLGKVPPTSLGEAIEWLKQAIEVEPNSPVANYNLGRAYLVRGKWDSAIAALNEVEEDHSQAGLAWVALSKAYLEKGNTQRAKEMAEKALEVDMDLPSAHLALARCRLAVGDISRATREVDQARALAETERKRRRSVQAAWYEGPQPNAKRAAYAVAWERRVDPDFAEVHLAKAELFLARGTEEGKPSFLVFLWRNLTGELAPLDYAMQEVELALKEHPGWYEALCLKGEVLLARDSLDEAIAAFDAAKEKDPQNPKAYLDFARTLQAQWNPLRNAGRGEEAQRRLELAQTQYRQLLQKDINPVQGHFGLGEIARLTKNWEEAEVEFQAVVDADPKHAEGYLRLGQVKWELGPEKEEEALSCFEEATSIAGKGTPIFVLAHNERGEIYLDQYLRSKNGGTGDPLLMSHAEQEFQAILDVWSDQPRALAGLGRIAYEKGQEEEAERLFRQALRKDSFNFGALYGLGRVYEAQGESAKALGYFRRAVEVTPGSIAARYHLGVSYYSQLQESEAEATFRWVDERCQQPSEDRRGADDEEACRRVGERLGTQPSSGSE